MLSNVFSDGTGWGQNLYNAYSTDPNDISLLGWNAINWWYNGEFSNYDTYGDASLLDLEDNPDDWEPPPAAPGLIFGHFTQTVWVVSVLFWTPHTQPSSKPKLIPCITGLDNGWLRNCPTRQ